MTKSATKSRKNTAPRLSKGTKRAKKSAERDIRAMIDSMTLEKVPPSSLVGWEENPRVHGDINSLLASMGLFGWTAPILAQRTTNRVLAGHRRVKSAIQKGLQLVPVIFFDFTDTEAAAYTVADNALAEQSDWEMTKLKSILDELKIDGFDLDMTGMDDLQVDFVLNEQDLLPAAPSTQFMLLKDLKVHPLDYRVHTDDELKHVIENL